MTGVEDLLQNSSKLGSVLTAIGAEPADRSRLVVERMPGALTNMTTEDLARVRVGRQASFVVKMACSPRYSPLWGKIPPQFHDEVMRELPWRAEADVYGSTLNTLLPAGLRMPVVYAIEHLGDDRVALWMEDVADRGTPWDRDAYRAAAAALGRMAGKVRVDSAPAGLPLQRRHLRAYFEGRVLFGAMPALRDAATWSHPRIAEYADPGLRGDLEDLVALAPDVLDRLEQLPDALAHGDACPQNLLRPIGNNGIFVAIDWTFAGFSPVGMDAGQLLAGHAESGELDPVALPRLLDDIVAAYTDGLLQECSGVDAAQASFGTIGNLVIRSAFTALPVEMLDAGEDEAFFARRAAYARFLVDLGLELCRSG